MVACAGWCDNKLYAGAYDIQGKTCRNRQEEQYEARLGNQDIRCVDSLLKGKRQMRNNGRD